MSDFVASNGFGVGYATNGVVYLATPDMIGKTYLSPGETDALREFFRDERDRELGRWRWPEHPEYVVYPEQKRVLDESTAHTLRMFERWVAAPANDHPHAPMLLRASIAYYEAHPESKPWRDAKPGEVWVITTENVGDEIAARVADLNEMIVFEYIKGLTRIAVTDTRIVSGRRIWPEGCDD